MDSIITIIAGIGPDALIYSIAAFGIFISFRLLDFPDLSVDGSFATGAAVMAVSIHQGWPLSFGLCLAATAGFLAGCCTALIHYKLRIPSLLAGILTMTMLYSVNIRIMGGRSNLQLIQKDLKNIFASFKSFLPALPPLLAHLCLLILILGVITVALNLFCRTDLGLTMGALGNNEQMIKSQGVNPNHVKLIGVGLSNALVALSGAILAQKLGFADVNLGAGLIVQGLAIVMIGEFILKTNRISLITLRIIIGAWIYRFFLFEAMNLGGSIGLRPSDTKLVSGLLIMLLLSLQQKQGSWLKGLVKKGLQK